MRFNLWINRIPPKSFESCCQEIIDELEQVNTPVTFENVLNLAQRQCYHNKYRMAAACVQKAKENNAELDQTKTIPQETACADRSQRYD